MPTLPVRLRPRPLLLAALLLLALAACAPKAPVLPPDTPPALGAELTEVLRTAGDNRREIQQFLGMYDQDPRRREAALFLAANLPPADRPLITARDLAENLDYAFLARESLPWGPGVPWNLFLNYVLPHRVTQEPFQPWRRSLFEELAPGQAKATMIQAARAVNLWTFRQAGFDTTSRWDQNPAMSLRRGFGRCEEAVILMVSALRSLGIPARDTGVSSWQHVNDNHVWVEAWIDGQWKVFEAGKSATPITGNVLKSPLVYAVAMGRADPADGEILRTGSGFTLVNVTSRYVPSGTIEIAVLDAQGRPWPKAPVFVSTFNYGSFRPGLRLICDQEGRASFTTGPATYLLTVAAGGRTDFAFASFAPQGGGFPARADLDLRRNRLPQGTAFLPFAHALPNPNLAQADPPVLVHEGQLPDADILDGKDRLERERLARYAGFGLLAARLSGIDPGDQAARSAPWPKALLASRGNLAETARAVQAAPPALAGQVREFLTRTDPKDLLAVTAPEAAADAELALAARDQARAMGLTYDEETFQTQVAAGRIEYEPFSFWRKELAPLARKLRGASLDETARGVAALVQGLPAVPPSFLGPRLRPQDAARAGFVTGPADRAILACALLRAAGIPARFLEEWGMVEYFDGTKHRPLHPEKPGRPGDREATALSRAYYADRGGLSLRLLQDGQPLSDREAPYFRAFTLSRFNPQGFFEALEHGVDGRYDQEARRYEVQVPPGRYWIFAARRNGSGEPHVRMVPVDIPPGGEALALDVSLDE